MKLKDNMKIKLRKNVAWSLAAVLAVSLAVSGCTNEGKESTEIEAIEVSSTEELLEAIAPDAHIVIKKGTYNFTEDIEDMVGDNYSKFNKKHDYVQLEECLDGVQIVIEGVDGLTISGQDGKDIELQVEPRYADVLTFRECSDIALENLTIGHTVEQGNCEGEVLQFEDSENITLTDLDLYGCGTYGICSIKSEGITMSDSIIRDCSYGIVDMRSSDASFKSCEFTGCEGFNLIEVSSSDLTFSKCTFDGNTGSGEFITYYNNGKNSVAFKACTFGESESLCIANETDSYGGSVSFDSKCTFADVSASSSTGVTSVTIDGPIDTAGEILESITPYADVSIEPGYYNLTEFIETVDVQGWNDTHEYVKINSVYDGYSVDIVSIPELSLHSSTYDKEDVEIVVEPRYAEVFDFENVTDVTISGITMGHTDAGECSGDVLGFYNCYGITLIDLDLYGCGVSGIDAYYSGDMYVYETIIRDCSGESFEICYATGPIVFMDCDLTGSTYAGYITPSRYIVEFFNCNFGEKESSIYYNRFAKLKDCTFDGDAPYVYDRPENYMGDHEGIDGLVPLTYTEFCDSSAYNDEMFYEAFEVITPKGNSILLPCYDDANAVDALYMVLGIFGDGTGFVNDSSGGDTASFIWEVADDDSRIILKDDPSADGAVLGVDEAYIYYYTDSYGEKLYIEFQLGTMKFWLVSM